MSLFQKIQTDMYEAMKLGDKTTSTTLRTALAKLKNKKIDKQDDLSINDEIKVLQMLVKQRKESIELYQKGDRPELVEVETKEMEILNNYLPKMMDENEIKNIVKTVIDDIGATSMADMGKIMPEVMKRGNGLIDGKSAQKFVNEIIG
tara:strand:- start:1848 stop:2291 length:444 start_codon:yes stop_codon:yes gene_type:complete